MARIACRCFPACAYPTGSWSPAATCCARARWWHRWTGRTARSPSSWRRHADMGRFNLSEWALRNRALVVYAMLLVALVGAWSYQRLGQSEDPPFTFKAMVVRTLWPGATAQEVASQVTERIERKLMTTGDYEFIRSYSRPAEAQVIFMARDSMRSKDVPGLWYQLRKKVGDLRPQLPQGVVGPFFHDEFGDTLGNVSAPTGPGFAYPVMNKRDKAGGGKEG